MIVKKYSCVLLFALKGDLFFLRQTRSVNDVVIGQIITPHSDVMLSIMAQWTWRRRDNLIYLYIHADGNLLNKVT